MGRNYTTYNNDIRIGNYSNYSALYLKHDTTAINTTKAGQWEISKTNDNAPKINPSSVQKADQSVGLSINSDSSIIKFNGNELVNVGTDQSINGTKIFNGVFQINPTGTNYNEGIRISKSTNGSSQIFFGVDPAQYSGQLQGKWAAGIMIRQDTMSQQFVVCLTSDFGNDDRGLRISADGNTLSFNGSVIAGTRATNGATNGSINYSAGNQILWGVNSVDTDGGFYSNGTNVFQRARLLTMGSIHPLNQ
ncbi:MAG: hypothetical protein EZS28_000436 [Streblomastix strix]|uniref:Uncharacterized protein n=1 Tax=Streblomastix strix TaxID=222440 RepID=A0A5J4XB48_9EUKA|nr:MAG: hypothetical protein EZS28_000436 [Streblomastix strix]